jgi:poly(A) polymerase
VEPAGKVDTTSWMTATRTAAVFAALTAEGATARFVGGCVRDAILDRASKDVDIATDATPEDVVRLLEAAGLKAVPTGIDHGTVTAVSGGHPFEVTTLRRDVETDGRRAQVAFTDDWVEDAARRDFTLNALYCDLDGSLYDPMEGFDDARAGRVRFVGDPDQRIEEDRLRILRFFRFHAWFGVDDLDAEGLAACRAGASGLSDLSAERIRVETLRLLEAPDPAPILKIMREQKVLGVVLPEASKFGRLGRLVEIENTLGRNDPVLRLGAVLAVDGDGMLAVSEKLRLSNADRDRLVAALDCGASIDPALSTPDVRRWHYALGADLFADVTMLRWAESSRETDDKDWANFVTNTESMPQRAFPLRGADALDLGVPPGPQVGDLLHQIEYWWIERDFEADRDACLAELKVAWQASIGGK